MLMFRLFESPAQGTISHQIHPRLQTSQGCRLIKQPAVLLLVPSSAAGALAFAPSRHAAESCNLRADFAAVLHTILPHVGFTDGVAVSSPAGKACASGVDGGIKPKGSSCFNVALSELCEGAAVSLRKGRGGRCSLDCEDGERRKKNSLELHGECVGNL
ncbi:uncharacterized protein CTRU02_214944 [Colletotrichum truncatum]|uniref:Uncharacterized protein n=1 Tax=Colletotrichum truncatum TaxID=5467 RepID=A0ACC3YEA2_COLTU|nr:uncharacterized protein CTRU02_08302 [Colletotrichum truncatum]KAF6790173.1 hypothetical protein CTRU02_08302 [Colletotrichum truncatum]